MPSPANKVQFSTVPKIALDALNHNFFPTACLHQLDSLVKLSLAGLECMFKTLASQLISALGFLIGTHEFKNKSGICEWTRTG